MAQASPSGRRQQRHYDCLPVADAAGWADACGAPGWAPLGALVERLPALLTGERSGHHDPWARRAALHRRICRWSQVIVSVKGGHLDAVAELGDGSATVALGLCRDGEAVFG